MRNWLSHERYIIPIIETFLETEKIDYTIKLRTVDASLYYKEQTIQLRIVKEYCKGEKFVAINKGLQPEVDKIMLRGFTFHSWLELKYKKNSQLSLSI